MIENLVHDKKPAPGLTIEAFDRLLAWLDADRDRAGKRYEEIRIRLIKIFVCRRCSAPEDLADKTIDRVARKVALLEPTYAGDPGFYFYGVAQKIFLEHLKKKPVIVVPEPGPVSSDDAELRYECLEQCMERLTAQNRELILAYYCGSTTAKIENRRALAERLGIGANALWIRTHRIRESLRNCAVACFRRRTNGLPVTGRGPEGKAND